MSRRREEATRRGVQEHNVCKPSENQRGRGARIPLRKSNGNREPSPTLKKEHTAPRNELRAKFYPHIPRKSKVNFPPTFEEVMDIGREHASIEQTSRQKF